MTESYGESFNVGDHVTVATNVGERFGEIEAEVYDLLAARVFRVRFRSGATAELTPREMKHVHD